MKFQKIIIALLAAILAVNTAGIIYIAKEERAQSEMIYLNTHIAALEGIGNDVMEDYAKLFQHFYDEYNKGTNEGIKEP